MTRRVYVGIPDENGDLYVDETCMCGRVEARYSSDHDLRELLRIFYMGQRVRVTIEPLSTAPDPKPCPSHPRKLWTD